MNVRIENVQKTFGVHKILKGVTLEIPERSFTVILGPSGSGKTTLLNIIAGIEPPSSGKILFSNNDVTNLSPKERDLSFVFQDYALYPHLTVHDNLAFPLWFKKNNKLIVVKASESVVKKSRWGVSCLPNFITAYFKAKKIKKNSIDESVTEIATKLKIQNLLKKKPNQLSGGEKQRVAIGRALIKKPSSNLFLFDEPLSNLDARLRIELREEIISLHKEFRTTAIYVTHDQSEAMSLADKIVIIKDGEIQQEGTPMDIYHNPKNLFVAQFIGVTPINLIPLNKNFFEGHDLRDPDNLLLRTVSTSFQEVVLGVRPEDIRIRSVGQGSLNGVILQKEFQGASVLFKVKSFGGKTLCVSTSTTEAVPWAEGESVSLVFEKNKLHFFDKLTEVSIENDKQL